MLGDRIHSAFASPLNRHAGLLNSVADRFDPFGLQQEVVVHEIDRTIALLLQMLELRDHVSGASRPPLPFIEDRYVAENAWPRTAARRLHRRKPLHRQHRRHIERHRLDEIEWQTLAVGKWPLVEISLHRAVRVVDGLAVSCPRDTRDCGGVVDPFDEI